MANSRQRRAARRNAQLSNVLETAEPTQKRTPVQTQQKDIHKPKIKRQLLGGFATIVGITASILSCFPHLTVSEPIQMNASDLFSYQMTITNDGLLPVFDVDWELAPRMLKIKPMEKPIQPITGVMVGIYPNATVIGPEDYAFGINFAETAHAGTLAPGDGYTFTTEKIIAAPPNAVADTVDFAIAITYVPIFPPIPMQTCSNFHIYQDRQGGQHWFRTPDRCNRFPWLHHWFDGARQPKTP